MGTSPWYYVATFAKLDVLSNPGPEYGATRAYARLESLLSHIRSHRGLKDGECCCVYRIANADSPLTDDAFVLRFNTIWEIVVADNVISEHNHYLMAKQRKEVMPV